MILNEENFNVSDFEKKFYNLSEFELEDLQIVGR